MPTKRRVILFIIVLTAMLLIKRAVGQEAQAVGWDTVYACYPESATQDAVRAIAFGIIFGIVSGVARALGRHSAALRGDYFSGDLVTLRIRN